MKKNRKRVYWFTALAMLAVTCVLILFITGTNSSSEQTDFSKERWTTAFQKLHHRLVKEYAFTEHKNIDWQSMYAAYYPQIKAAQEKNDFDSYYVSLRTYLHCIPDGHVIINNLNETDYKYVGGGYGLAVTRLDDGKVIISWVDTSGPAWQLGIKTGAELISWNGMNAQQAIDRTSIVFSSIPATDENKLLKKTQYLVRSPVGTQTEIQYMNPEDLSVQTAVIKAYDDKGVSLKKNYPDSVVSDKLRDMFLNIETPEPIPDAMVQYRMFDENISYIKILGEFDADFQQTGNAPSTLGLFRQAVEQAIEKNSPVLIVDLRNNLGGLDSMAADILGSFYDEKSFFEYQNVYNYKTSKRELSKDESHPDSLELFINPAEKIFKGTVLALVNPKCVSSGEGVAMGISKLKNAQVIGFYGTNGSFGLVGAQATMPGGVTVKWPSGQSLDKDKNIQLDSRNGKGGVSPTIRIPITEKNAILTAQGVDIELEEALKFASQLINK
jgi:carboxyl-terminal processing protease